MLKKIFLLTVKIIYTIVMGVMVLFAALNAYTLIARLVFGVKMPMIMGHSAAVVVSGSMEPAIMVDDVILVSKKADYEIGDILVYERGDKLITHRVTQKSPGTYVTKGDANLHEDEPVKEEQVKGKVVKILPKAGQLLKFLRTPLGMAVMIAVVLLYIYLPSICAKLWGSSAAK